MPSANRKRSSEELYEAVLEGKPEEEIERLVKFYDYLEIQPTGNNLFMLNSERYNVNSLEDLQNINRKIIELGGETFKACVCNRRRSFFKSRG